MTEQSNDIETNSLIRTWTCCNENVPSNEMVFFAQVIMVYIVIITCIVNLSLQNEPRELWIALLSSSLGYILPSPQLTRIKQNLSS